MRTTHEKVILTLVTIVLAVLDVLIVLAWKDMVQGYPALGENDAAKWMVFNLLLAMLFICLLVFARMANRVLVAVVLAWLATAALLWFLYLFLTLLFSSGGMG